MNVELEMTWAWRGLITLLLSVVGGFMVYIWKTSVGKLTLWKNGIDASGGIITENKHDRICEKMQGERKAELKEAFVQHQKWLDIKFEYLEKKINGKKQ